MKKVISIFLVLSFLLSVVYAEGVDLVGLSVDSGVATVTLSGISTDGKISLVVQRNGAIAYGITSPIVGSSMQLAIPARQLSGGEYVVGATYIDGSGRACSTISTTYIVGNQPSQTLPIVTGVPRVNSPDLSRCVLTPFAKVYSDAGMSVPVVQLKRYDLVHVYSYANGIAHVKYTIMSGNGSLSVENNINALYTSDDDLVGTGYMYISDLELPNVTALSQADKQRYAVELAYSRLGIRGPYSQSRRFLDYYLDCAALVSWCWYNCGVDWTYYGTAVSGIEAWASSTPGVLIWNGVENATAAQSAYDAKKTQTPYERHVGSIVPAYNDAGRYILPATSPYTGHTISTADVENVVRAVALLCKNESYTTQQAYAEVLLNMMCFEGKDSSAFIGAQVPTDCSQIQYQAVYAAINGVDRITNNGVLVFSDSEPTHLFCRTGKYYCGYKTASDAEMYQGDIRENRDGSTSELDRGQITSYLRECDDGVFALMQPGDLIVWNYPTVVTAPDGTQMTVQVNETGSFGGDHVAIFVGYDPATKNATIIESSIASAEPGQNTKVSVIGPYSAKRQNIIKVIRPTGGTVIDAGTYTSSIDYEFLGSVNSFLACPIRNSIAVTIPFGSVIPDNPHFSGPHNGMDFKTNLNAKVYAVEDGTVIAVGTEASGNSYIQIRHENGLMSVYKNLSTVTVAIGDSVRRDQWIGRTATDPTTSDVGLLHFEIWDNGVPTDPAKYLS